MPEKKRPPFAVMPRPSASVSMKASSISTVFSGVKAASSEPRKFGSMFAVRYSSDSVSYTHLTLPTSDLV